jgi:hypothetical protein
VATGFLRTSGRLHRFKARAFVTEMRGDLMPAALGPVALVELHTERVMP